MVTSGFTIRPSSNPSAVQALFRGCSNAGRRRATARKTPATPSAGARTCPPARSGHRLKKAKTDANTKPKVRSEEPRTPSALFRSSWKFKPIVRLLARPTDAQGSAQTSSFACPLLSSAGSGFTPLSVLIIITQIRGISSTKVGPVQAQPRRARGGQPNLAFRGGQMYVTRRSQNGNGNSGTRFLLFNCLVEVAEYNAARRPAAIEEASRCFPCISALRIR